MAAENAYEKFFGLPTKKQAGTTTPGAAASGTTTSGTAASGTKTPSTTTTGTKTQPKQPPVSVTIRPPTLDTIIRDKDTGTGTGTESEMTDEERAAADLESRTFGIPNRDVDRPSYAYTDVPTPVRGDQQSWQGQDMYSALLALQNQYNANMAGARPKTEAEIQQQAGADYASYYDQLRRAAANQYALQDLSYLQQRQGIQNSYDKNREASARNYAQNYSQADRQLLARGMQRSSYGAQTLANIARQGAEAQQAIWDQQIQSEGNIDALRQQLLANYANTQQGYDAGQASDVMSRIWGLRDTEYDRQVARANTLNQLATQLYSYLNGINEVGREQHNTEANLRENQHQFDTNVAESRQGVLDTRVNNQMSNDLNWAQLLEQMYQYTNNANWEEAKFRFQNPTYGYTRASDGRLVADTSDAGKRRVTSYGGGSGPTIIVNRPTGNATTGNAAAGAAQTTKPSGSGNSAYYDSAAQFLKLMGLDPSNAKFSSFNLFGE